MIVTIESLSDAFGNMKLSPIAFPVFYLPCGQSDISA